MDMSKNNKPTAKDVKVYRCTFISNLKKELDKAGLGHDRWVIDDINQRAEGAE